MNIILKCCFFILGSCSFLFAQDAKPDAYQDSLQIIIDKNEVKIKTKEALFLLGEYLVKRDPSYAHTIAENLKRNYIGKTDSSDIRRNNYIFAAGHRWKGDFITALTYYKANYKYSKQHNDSLQIAKSAHFSGSLNMFLGNNVISQKHLLEATKIYNRLGSVNQQANISNTLGKFYSNINQEEKGEEKYLNALKKFEVLNDSIGLSTVNANLGLFYTELGEFKKAEYHLMKQKGYNIIHPTLREMGFHYDYLGYLRLKEDRFEDAYQAIIKSLKIRENLSSTYNICESKLSAADVLIKLNRNDEAIKHLKDVINFSNSKHQSLNHQIYAYDLLTEAYEKTGNYKDAFINLKAYNVVNDSVFSKESMEIIADKDAKYDKQKKDTEIALLNKEKEISRNEASRSKTIAIISSISLLLLLIGAIALYKLYIKINQKNKIITKALEDRELLLHETHHRVKNNLQMISSLLNLQSKHVKDEKIFEVLQNGRNRVQSMAILHKNLYVGEDLNMVNIQNYFEGLIKNILDSYKKTKDEVGLKIEAKGIMMDVESVVPIGLIVNELITNSLKHAFTLAETDTPEVIVKMVENDVNYILSVKDNGVGIDTDILKNKTGSFGQRLIQLFTNKLKANMSINNQNGTEVVITFLK